MTSAVCPVCGQLVPVRPGEQVDERFSARYWIISAHNLRIGDGEGIVVEQPCLGRGLRV